MALEPTKLADVIPTDDTERVFKDLVTFSKRPKRVIHEFPNLLWLIFNISRRWKNKHSLIILQINIDSQRQEDNITMHIKTFFIVDLTGCYLDSCDQDMLVIWNQQPVKNLIKDMSLKWLY